MTVSRHAAIDIPWARRRRTRSSSARATASGTGTLASLCSSTKSRAPSGCADAHGRFPGWWPMPCQTADWQGLAPADGVVGHTSSRRPVWRSARSSGTAHRNLSSFSAIKFWRMVLRNCKAQAMIVHHRSPWDYTAGLKRRSPQLSGLWGSASHAHWGSPKDPGARLLRVTTLAAKPLLLGSATSVFATLAAPSKLIGVGVEANDQRNLLHFLIAATPVFQPIWTNGSRAARVAKEWTLLSVAPGVNGNQKLHLCWSMAKGFPWAKWTTVMCNVATCSTMRSEHITRLNQEHWHSQSPRFTASWT